MILQRLATSIRKQDWFAPPFRSFLESQATDLVTELEPQ